MSLQASESCLKADKESNRALKVVNGCREQIKKHNDRVKQFNQNMMGVSTREVKRIEAEHQYAKAIAANAGKELDFF